MLNNMEAPRSQALVARIVERNLARRNGIAYVDDLLVEPIRGLSLDMSLEMQDHLEARMIESKRNGASPKYLANLKEIFRSDLRKLFQLTIDDASKLRIPPLKVQV